MHNLESIKQLFIKVIDCVTTMEHEKVKKKKEEKVKEFEVFFKVFASLTGIEEAKRDIMIEGIRRMNTVGHSRNSSSSHRNSESGNKS